MARLRHSQRLLEIGDNIVDMLYADGQPDHLRSHAGLFLLLRRHLPMRRRGRVTGERLGVTHIDQPLEQFQRVVERLSGIEAAGNAESQKRAGSPVQIFLRQRVIGIVGETGIVDPCDSRIAAQEFGDAACVRDVTIR
jgi:hypothetical protein